MLKGCLTTLAVCMLAYVVFMHVMLGRGFAAMALGYVAGGIVACAALVVHMFYKKGEVR